MELPESVIEKFRSVTQERLERIDASWNALTRGVASPKLDAELLRELHTLKGDARVVGFIDVGVLCQRLEDVVAASRARNYQVHEDVDIVVTMAVQFVGMLVRRRADTARSGIDLDGFLRQIENVIHECLKRSSEAPEHEVSARPRGRLPGRSSMRPTAAARQRIGDVATIVFLESLRAVGASERRLHDAFRSLVDELTALERTPLSPALEVQALAANELAHRLGKKVDVVVDGANVRVSVEILDVVQTAVLHAVRNAIDHGLEASEERLAHGKSETGSIKITARQIDDELEVSIVDDGRGVDLEGIRKNASARGILTATAAAAAKPEELLALAFEPGLSTRAVAGEISGRGIGMDAIRDAVSVAGGRVELRSEFGKGTTLSIRVPQRRATLAVHTLRAVGVAIPIAVSGEWLIEKLPDDAAGLNVADALQLSPEKNSHSVSSRIKLKRSGSEVVIAASVTGTDRVAMCLCPVLPGALVEVVRIDDREMLLLHPEQMPLEQTRGQI